MENKLKQLREFLDGKGITQESIASELGVHKTYVNQLLTGRKQFGKKTAKLWSDHFGLSYTWLLTGEGVMMNDQTVRPAKPGEGVPVYDIGISDKGVPFIGDTEHVNAGPLAGFGEGITASDITDYVLLPMLKHREGDFAVRTRGRSMIDTRHPDQNINDGAIICVRPWHERHIQWGEIYCIATTDGYAVKRLMPSQNDNALRCVSSNEEEGYLPYDVPTADIKGIGKVTAIINLQLL